MITQTTVRRIILFLAMLLTGGNILIPRIPLLVLVIILCSLLPRFWTTVRTELLTPGLVLGAIFVISLVRTSDFVGLAIRFANFSLALMLLNLYVAVGFDRLVSDLLPMLKLFAIQAIATFALALVVPFAFFNVGELYRTIFFLFTVHQGARPDGFFYEPGVFQFYLNILLYASLFVFESRKWIVVATLAVFVTLSTTGIIITSLLLATYFGKRMSTAKRRRRILVFLVGLLLAGPVGYFSLTSVFSKVTGDERGSFLIRQYDTLTGLNVMAANPYFGIGFEQEKYVAAKANLGYSFDVDESVSARYTELSSERFANTNSIVYLSYSLGIPLALIFFIGIFRQRFFERRLLFGFVVFLTLLSETLIYLPFMMMLIFSGMMYRFRIGSALSGRTENMVTTASEAGV